MNTDNAAHTDLLTVELDEAGIASEHHAMILEAYHTHADKRQLAFWITQFLDVMSEQERQELGKKLITHINESHITPPPLPMTPAERARQREQQNRSKHWQPPSCGKRRRKKY